MLNITIVVELYPFAPGTVVDRARIMNALERTGLLETSEVGRLHIVAGAYEHMINQHMHRCFRQLRRNQVKYAHLPQPGLLVAAEPVGDCHG